MSSPISALMIPAPPAQVAIAETRVATWIGQQDDPDSLREARRQLAALRGYFERGSEQAQAAIRLDLRAQRRIGVLLGSAKVGGPNAVVTRGDDGEFGPTDDAVPGAERMAVSIALDACVRDLGELPEIDHQVVDRTGLTRLLAERAKEAKILFRARGQDAPEQLPLLISFVEDGRVLRLAYLNLNQERHDRYVASRVKSHGRQAEIVARLLVDQAIYRRHSDLPSLKEAFAAEGVEYEVLDSAANE